MALLLTVLLPLIGSVLLYVLPVKYDVYARLVAFVTSLRVLLITCDLWYLFDETQPGYQFTSMAPFLVQYGVPLSLGIDGISLVFLVLNAFRVPICLMASWDSVNKLRKEYYALFLAMAGFVNLVFVTNDLVLFYIGFEVVLIPMYLIIGYWGSRERKIRASYFFFRFTLLGSMALFISILYMVTQSGSTDMSILKETAFANERWLWLAFFVSFAVKVPMVPVHIWLPEAHVEAPTAGSVYLAGILLKLGTYGLLRLSIPFFPTSTLYFSPLVIMLCLVAILYGSLTAIRQTDMKRIIAYASVAHMNMTLLGIFSMDSVGFAGGVLQMLSHGIVSGALFLCVGVVYDRYHSRLISYYGGRAQFMPRYAVFFLVFSMANIAIPGTSSFCGEFLIFIGRFSWTTVGTFFASSGLVLGGAYSLWLLNRVIYGNIKTSHLEWMPDLNRMEVGIFLPLALITLWMGVYPEAILTRMQVPVDLLVQDAHHG